MNNYNNNNKNLFSRVGESLSNVPFVRAWKEKGEERKNTDPELRVKELNGCFDRIVLPAIIVAVVLFVIFAIVPKLSCSSSKDNSDAAVAENADFATRREVLLNCFSDYIAVLEDVGFFYDSENDYAFISYDDGIDIIEHYTDSNGSVCTLIINSSTGSDGDIASIWYYSERLILVMVTRSGNTVSAVFTDDSFTKGVSGSDISDVLEYIEISTLSEMLESYKNAINSVFE